MSLSELKFSTTDKRPTPAFKMNQTERSRAVILNAIQVQRELIEADRTGVHANLTKTVKHVDDDGTVSTTVIDRKPRKWYWKNAQNKFVVEMLYGGHPVLVNGKDSVIEAGNLDDVEKILTILAESTSKGELDKALDVAKSKRKAGHKKAA